MFEYIWLSYELTINSWHKNTKNDKIYSIKISILQGDIMVKVLKKLEIILLTFVLMLTFTETTVMGINSRKK